MISSEKPSKSSKHESPAKSTYFDEQAGEDLDLALTLQSSAESQFLPPDFQMGASLSYWQTLRFFLKHSIRDVRRRKCHFCLALCSVLIVVLSTLVVNTVISKGPVIFMKLAQQESGEIDCVFMPDNQRVNSNLQWKSSWSMNYTQAVAVLDEHAVDHYLSPRYQMCPHGDQISFTDLNGNELENNGTMCLKFIDTEQERQIDVGVGWPFPEMDPYQCIISDKFMKEGIAEGDTVRITLLMNGFWNNMRYQYNLAAKENGWNKFPEFNKEKDQEIVFFGQTVIDCQVLAMIGDTYGKMPSKASEEQIIMEYAYFTDMLANTTTFNETKVDAETAAQFKAWMLSVPDLAYQYSSMILANMPSPRYKTYENNNFQAIQDEVLSELYVIAKYLGLYNVGANLQLLTAMQNFSFSVLFIGLIFDVLLLIFIVVSCLLIYSLLLISVETKTFEIGVMRLLGLTKAGFVGMIVTQASLFVVPSVILGFTLSVPCIWLVYGFLFTEDLGFRPSIMPGWYATIQALIIGICIPIVSSIIPIKRALSKNLNDSLNVQRSKNSGMLITFTDNQSKNLGPYLVFGSIAVLFGVSIYYYLPMGLLEQNYGIILSIFFMILLGMMFGLTLFATNLQGVLEIVLVYLFFFWEQTSMRALLRKNFSAHKQRNYLTSIIYALTLGCIIFLLVTASLQVQSLNASAIVSDADIHVYGTKSVNTTLTDPILRKYADQIDDFAYVTNAIHQYQEGSTSISFADKANIVSRGQQVSAFTPSSIVDKTLYISYVDSPTSLPPSEQLYTARGSQSVASTKPVIDEMIHDLHFNSTLLMKSAGFTERRLYFQKRIQWTVDRAPDFQRASFPNIGFVSVPMLAHMAQTSVEEINPAQLLIRMKDSGDHQLLQQMKLELMKVNHGSVSLIYEAKQSTEEVEIIIDYVFMVTIAIMMFLCFFSLSASMSANLYDQMKEIGVLRSIGFTTFRIKLLYFYEALVLVFAACMNGVLIGVIVGYTMKLQMDLFLDQVSTFYFPWRPLAEILLLSVLCAFFSTFGPTTELTKKEIAQIFRLA